MVDETAMDKTLQMYANPAMIQATDRKSVV